MQKLTIKISLSETYDSLPLPKYGTEFSSGMDLHVDIKDFIIIKPSERVLIPTGIFAEIPIGYEIQIRPRSGLAWKNGITVLNSPGTIDSDYRGEIKVIIINLSQADFIVQRGDKIAQMVVSPVIQAELQVVSTLEGSERGKAGFGSTGINLKDNSIK